MKALQRPSGSPGLRQGVCLCPLGIFGEGTEFGSVEFVYVFALVMRTGSCELECVDSTSSSRNREDGTSMRSKTVEISEPFFFLLDMLAIVLVKLKRGRDWFVGDQSQWKGI